MTSDRETHAQFIFRQAPRLKRGDIVVNHGALESSKIVFSGADLMLVILTFEHTRFSVPYERFMLIERVDPATFIGWRGDDANPSPRQRPQAIRGVSIE